MNSDRFDFIFENRIEKMRTTAHLKSTEYAPVDRLSNFKKAAAFRGTTLEDALFGMEVKHLVAIDDFIKRIPNDPPYEQWDEKINDSMLYFILLDAIVIERKGK